MVDEKDIKMLNGKIDGLRKSIGQRLASLKKDTKEIKSHVKDINGRVGEVENKARNLEEGTRRKELDCPFRETIAKMAENALTSEKLKEFIDERDRKSSYRIKAWGAALTAVFAAISLFINFIL